jgi:hypothetical protein
MAVNDIFGRVLEKTENGNELVLCSSIDIVSRRVLPQLSTLKLHSQICGLQQVEAYVICFEDIRALFTTLS